MRGEKGTIRSIILLQLVKYYIYAIDSVAFLFLSGVRSLLGFLQNYSGIFSLPLIKLIAVSVDRNE